MKTSFFFKPLFEKQYRRFPMRLVLEIADCIHHRIMYSVVKRQNVR